ncbi:DUF2087 domain-containing protein [Streptomyces sp. KLOTTS4A1]|uniref:DUF2087 domain-containing protein n=1 Tax=Streptomyces sp. KLOTTS4A1 TaxID=3390996 RepID=UPI0039F4F165
MSRQLLSALADPERLKLYASIVRFGDAAEATGGKQGQKHLSRLIGAGLIEPQPDGSFKADAAVFQKALATGTRTEDQDVPQELWPFFAEGRLRSMPMRPAVRHELLAHLVRTLFEAARDYTEPEVNRRFTTVHEDSAMLRRYCVDGGLLRRTKDGTRYQAA